MQTAQIFLLAVATLGAPSDLAVDPAAKFVTVYGEAQTLVSPNIAELQFAIEAPKSGSVETIDADAISAVTDAVSSAGVAPEDVHVLGSNFASEFKPGVPFKTHVGGLRCVITVKLRALGKLKNVVDAAESHGAGLQILHYDLSDRKSLEDVLRIDAMADARRKAETFARAAGQKLGPVHALVEDGAGLLGQVTRAPTGVFINSSGADSGAITMTEIVYVSYELTPQ